MGETSMNWVGIGLEIWKQGWEALLRLGSMGVSLMSNCIPSWLASSVETELCSGRCTPSLQGLFPLLQTRLLSEDQLSPNALCCRKSGAWVRNPFCARDYRKYVIDLASSHDLCSQCVVQWWHWGQACSLPTRECQHLTCTVLALDTRPRMRTWPSILKTH